MQIDLDLIKELVEGNEGDLTLLGLYDSIKDISPYNQMIDKLNIDLDLSPSKSSFINSRIDEVKGMFIKGTHDGCGIIQYPGANPLVKYGYESAINHPVFPLSIIRYEVMFEKEFYKKLLLIDEYSQLSVDTSKTTSQLSFSEMWYECLYFILFGVQYSVYTGVLEGYLAQLNRGETIRPVKTKEQLSLREQVLLLDHILKLANNNKSPLDNLTDLPNFHIDKVGQVFGYILKGDATNTRKYILSGRYKGASQRDKVYNASSIKRVNEILSKLSLPVIDSINS